MKKHWKLIVGILCIIGGLGNIGTSAPAVVLGLALGGVLIILHFRKAIVPEPAPETATIERETASDMVKRISQQYEHIKFKVKGVTFKNDDGSSRQTILRKLKFRDPPFDEKVITSLEEYEFDGERALAICVNDLQIGSLPKELLDIAFEHIDDNLCISAVDVYGGGKDEDGERRNYGAEAYLRYDR